MRRFLPILVLAAACGPKSSSTGPSNHGGTPGSALSVEVSPATEEFTASMQAANGSHFPAISADGTTIVDLSQDGEDFSGIPITSIVFFTKAGRGDVITLASAMAGEQADDPAPVVAKANAALAKTTWRPLDVVEATGEDPDSGAPDTLTFEGGFVVKLADVAEKFPPGGTLPTGMENEDGSLGCGEVLGLTHGYGSQEAGFVVVYPQVNLGGDDCMGNLQVDQALIVPTR